MKVNILLGVGLSLLCTVGLASSDEYLKKLSHIGPIGQIDHVTGRIDLDLTEINQKLIPMLQTMNIFPNEIWLQINGGHENQGEDLRVNLGANHVSYQGFAGDKQQYVRVMLKQEAKIVHLSEVYLFANLTFPRLRVNHPDIEMHVPSSFSHKSGMDDGLVKLSSEIQHRNTSWTLSGTSNNSELRNEFYRYGAALKPKPILNTNNQLDHWQVINRANGHTFEAKVDEILLTADAAFSEHHYYWDSHIIAEALAATDPEIALATVESWLNAQRPNGGIPRETDLKWAPYQPEIDIKFGHARANTEWFNPPLAGWTVHQLAAWAPEKMPELLPRVIESSKKHRQWLLRTHGVFADHKLQGFLWSNLGSGRDNAPRPLDHGGLAVDLLAQYKMMLDHEREFHLILGHFAEAEHLAHDGELVANLLRARYYNTQRHWYFDLEPDGAGGYKQNSEMTLAAFWVVAAKVPDQNEVNALIKHNLRNPQRFGGGPFLPSVAKDSINYDENGHYWRGGGWPPDFNMVMRALFETGHRALASQLMQEHLAAMTTASNLFAMGVTPQNMIDYLMPLLRKPADEQDANFAQLVKERMHQFFLDFESGAWHAEKPPGRGTVFEALGLYRNHEGRAMVTFNQEMSSPPNIAIHETRVDFGGWGAAVALNSPRHLAGLDAVPRFHGRAEDQKHWLFILLTDPEFRYHQVSQLPALKPVAVFLETHPQISFAQFDREFALSEAMLHELDQVAQGYVEVSPTFDPEVNQTVFKNLIYAGSRFDLAIDASPSEVNLAATVRSQNPIAIQFNRHWVRTRNGSESTDMNQDASAIINVDQATPDGVTLHP